MNDYEVLKELCVDNGRLREHYYYLTTCYSKALKMCYGEYLSGNMEHKHSNLYSVVFDYCKEHNLLEYVNVFTTLIETTDIKIGISPMGALHNYEIKNGLKHFKESEG